MTAVLRVAILVLFALATFAPLSSRAQDETPEAECVETTPEENLAIVETYWQEFVWGKQGKLADIVAEDEVHHWGIGSDTSGFDEFMERVQLFVLAFPDLEFTIDLAVAEGDLVGTSWTATGTHLGEWQGIPPTETEVSYTGSNLFRIECGKIVESWGAADHFGLMQQLGGLDLPMMAMATPAAAASAEATPCPDDTPEANVAVALRWTEDVMSEQDLDVLDEILAPTAIHHGASFPDAVGQEEVKAAISRLVDTFDMDLTAAVTIASDDLVAVRWEGTGTLKGPWLGVDATGETVTIIGNNFYRVQCGKIVEGWSEMNAFAVYSELASSSGAATPEA